MAAKIRKTALQTIQPLDPGILGDLFSIADILSVLYFEKMNVDPMSQMILIEIDWYYLRDIAHRLCMQRWH